MSVLTPSARQIDRHGQRFGAGASALILVLSYALNAPWLAALAGLNLLLSAAFGTRFFLPGRPWPVIRRALRLQPEPEHEYPPRFAQAMGGSVVAMAAIAFALHFEAPGWVLVAMVVALQTLLAATGYCLGCRLYFVRWLVPSLFARMIGRGGRPRLAAQRLRKVEG